MRVFYFGMFGLAMALFTPAAVRTGLSPRAPTSPTPVPPAFKPYGAGDFPPGLAPNATASPARLDLAKCRDGFHCATYLEVAAALQALPEGQRAAQLRAWAAETNAAGIYRPGGGNETPVIILCKMLFEAPAGKIFRRALVGGPTFIGQNTQPASSPESPNAEPVYDPKNGRYPAFPDEPLAFVGDIPFEIVRGYSLGGSPEHASHYLDYCLAEMRWTSRQYAPADQKKLQAALDTLLKPPLWKRPLRPEEVASLTRQIQPPVLSSAAADSSAQSASATPSPPK